MRTRTAFTLVELMVAIAIISLLIAILAPVLGTVKDMAAFAKCQATLSALAKSSLAYTELNRGHMMIFKHEYHDVNGVKYLKAAEEPVRTTVAYDVNSSIDPATGCFSRAMQYGLLYSAKILYPPDMFYCAGRIQSKVHTLGSYPRPWGATRSDAGTQFVRCGYMWNPWVKEVETDKWAYEDDLLLERHPLDRFLTSDMLWGTEVAGHAQGISARWNLGFSDGHISSWESKALWMVYYASNASTGARWVDWNRVTRPLLP